MSVHTGGRVIEVRIAHDVVYDQRGDAARSRRRTLQRGERRRGGARTGAGPGTGPGAGPGQAAGDRHADRGAAVGPLLRDEHDARVVSTRITRHACHTSLASRATRESALLATSADNLIELGC